MKNPAKIDLGGALGPPGGLLEAMCKKKRLGVRSRVPLRGGLENLLSRLESQDGSKLSPKREVLGVLKRSENECIIGSLLGSTFSWIWVDFWKAKWSQVGIKLKFNNDRTWKSVFLTNLRFPLVLTTIGRVAHVEVGRKNDEKLKKDQSKMDQKLKPKMGSLLASVFGGFWWVLGCKLAPKIALKSISRGIQKGMPKSKHLRSE